MESAARITCPHCGEQNYETDLVCWACNAALHVPPSGELPVGDEPLPPDLPDALIEPLPGAYSALTEAPLDGLSKFALAAVSVLVPGAGLLAGVILLTVRQSAQNRHFGIVCLGLALIPAIIWLLLGMSVLLPLLSEMMRQFTGPAGPLGDL
jgi:hypothetical protein